VLRDGQPHGLGKFKGAEGALYKVRRAARRRCTAVAPPLTH
jgi:hypothetical protein